MNLLQPDTLVISFVVAAVGWGLKEIIKTLIATLVKTIAKVEVLESKLSEFIKLVGEMDKMKKDLNELHARIRDIKKEGNA